MALNIKMFVKWNFFFSLEIINLTKFVLKY